jgi:hypothetical protein
MTWCDESCSLLSFPERVVRSLLGPAPAWRVSGEVALPDRIRPAVSRPRRRDAPVPDRAGGRGRGPGRRAENAGPVGAETQITSVDQPLDGVQRTSSLLAEPRHVERGALMVPARLERANALEPDT